MKLALIGRNIQHSKSPDLYRKLIDHRIEYDLIDVSDEKDLPDLSELSKKYDGINITSPYKRSYLDKVCIEKVVESLKSINTISFSDEPLATNTDYYGLKIILNRYKGSKVILLGNGSMAAVTFQVMKELNIDLMAHFYRKKDGELFQLDLSGFNSDGPVLIINSCSRDFVFDGKLPKKAVFLDYNYNFTPHYYLQNELVYQDGLELLQLQAQAAVEFWKRTNPKLK